MNNKDDLEYINLDTRPASSSPRVEVNDEPSKDKKKPKKDSLKMELLKTGVYLLIVLIVTLIIVKFVAQRTVVVGHSMNPTLSDGDNLIVDKITYKFNDPERFDIIVFPYRYEKNTYYIKRIIGLPGERVRIDIEGNIYINDKILKENYGAEPILDPGVAFNEIKLGKDEYFVLGDNRNHSSDSRNEAVGNIRRSEIIGKAWLRIYPFNKMKFVKHK